MSGDEDTLWCFHLYLSDGTRLDDLRIRGRNDEDYMRAAVQSVIDNPVNFIRFSGRRIHIGYQHVVAETPEQPRVLDTMILNGLSIVTAMRGAMQYVYEQAKREQDNE